MGLKHHCGLFGVVGCPDASRLVYLGLYALQHRGQESSGIVASDGASFHSHKALGLVVEVFEESVLGRLKGHLALGHNRYSTTGSTRVANIQPLVVDLRGMPVAIAHNGNLVNAGDLRARMERDGSIFQSTTDSEIVVHLMAKAGTDSLAGMIESAIDNIRGAYCLLLLTPDSLVAIRDPNGFRPLCFGRTDDAIFFSSETCGLDVVGAVYEREIAPGEMVIAQGNEVTSTMVAASERKAHCVFELIYFSRPDSRVFGISVDKARKGFGRRLALEHPASADMVISVPDSSNAAALGYSMESGVPLEFGLIRNHYVGRTFIYPTRELRDNRVRIKYNPVRELLRGKRVIVVDDSIVRGTTSKKLMHMLRAVGVREIHLRVSSPPIAWPCFYGIDTPDRDELVAANASVEEIRHYLGVDSLGYLSVEGLLEATGLPPKDFCVACFTGDYPVLFSQAPTKLGLERLARRRVRSRSRLA
ncbi:MAG TPA: amidophosphoribosyltransferase [bacterium]|nr:amidophosphoribosyltransferase [bacterium]